MSTKRSVPTFRVYIYPTAHGEEFLEGPIVSPDKSEVATTLTELHSMLDRFESCLCYAKKWWYIPRPTLTRVCMGERRFDLPWPLTADDERRQEEA
ncbi:MAG: hypothetical protein OWT28_11495 [Firmicutes bacterium]|nr:hypothetical protein [Bacillota bacterium]